MGKRLPPGERKQRRVIMMRPRIDRAIVARATQEQRSPSSMIEFAVSFYLAAIGVLAEGHTQEEAK